jgi:hypothetical protein
VWGVIEKNLGAFFAPQKTPDAWASSIFVSAQRVQKYDQPGFPLQFFGIRP